MATLDKTEFPNTMGNMKDQLKKQYENFKTLLDGRAFYTKDNGFTYMMIDQKGVHTKITREYYRKLVQLNLKQKKKAYAQQKQKTQQRRA